MQNREDLQLMVQVARLYYESEQTQQQIARRLQITRQKVSRLLSEARAEGVVRISIYDPTPSDPQLSDALCKAFHLHHVVLTSSEGLDNGQLRSHLGMAAAEFLPQMFADDQMVGNRLGTDFVLCDQFIVQNKAGPHPCGALDRWYWRYGAFLPGQ